MVTADEIGRVTMFSALCGDVRSCPVKRVAAAVGEGSMAIAFVPQYVKQGAV
jgi:thioredoxin reductase